MFSTQYNNTAGHAGQRLAELSLVSNKVWVRHFKDKPRIKNDMAAIFDNLTDLARRLQNENDMLQKQLREGIKREHDQKEKFSKVKLQYKILQREVDVRDEVARKTAGAFATSINFF